MVDKQNINLARKWRPIQFEDVIGQDLAIKILRNSIFLNHFLPVYLFAGQRGCGKTSTARIFAMALNCAKISDFQKEPKACKLPCLECFSCTAMKEGKHPDFIEIDAASNTGVENIRQIIDSSTFLPVLGIKKIYLIDEAHMLSRAAFNAFLKLLEEPPASVIFILATTEPDKILDTVKSRSFQLFFNFVDQKSLTNSLKKLCDTEGIEYDIEALGLISCISEGSVRDAQNLLERVRFASEKVSKKIIYAVLGLPSEEFLLELAIKLINQVSVQDFLHFLKNSNFYNFAANHVYEKLISVLRDIIYLQNGIDVGLRFTQDVLTDIALSDLVSLIRFLCGQENALHAVNNKSIYLEILFLDYISKKKSPLIEIDDEVASEFIGVNKLKNKPDVFVGPIEKNEPKAEITTGWDGFLNLMKNSEDSFLQSIFSQAKFDSVTDNGTGVIVKVVFAKRFAFLQATLLEIKDVWIGALRIMFGENVNLEAIFEGDEVIKESIPIVRPVLERANSERLNVEVSVAQNNTKPSYQSYSKSVVKKVALGREFDISDKNVWKFANELVAEFPGKIYLINEGSNE